MPTLKCPTEGDRVIPRDTRQTPLFTGGRRLPQTCHTEVTHPLRGQSHLSSLTAMAIPMISSLLWRPAMTLGQERRSGAHPRQGGLETATLRLTPEAQEKCLVRRRIADASRGLQPGAGTGTRAMKATGERSPTALNARIPPDLQQSRIILPIKRGAKPPDSGLRFRYWRPHTWSHFRTMHRSQARAVQLSQLIRAESLASVPCRHPLQPVLLRPDGQSEPTLLRNQDCILGRQASARPQMVLPRHHPWCRAHFLELGLWRGPYQGRSPALRGKNL
jgi:hypothetical protein